MITATHHSYNKLITTEKRHPLPIKPPRSTKKQSSQQHDIRNNSPSYSLFDSISPSKDWIDYSIENRGFDLHRKHSVSVDGSDYPSVLPSRSTYEKNDRDFWRRASLPNNHFSTPTLNCRACSSSFCSSIEFSCTRCDLPICRDCINPITLACPICINKNCRNQHLPVASSLPKILDLLNCKQEKKQPYFTTLESNITANNIPSKIPPPPSFLIYPEEDETFYIGDLLSPSVTLDSAKIQQQFATLYCVKLTNIPWDVSQKDVKLFFQDFELPSSSMFAQSIHIMMDRTTGKTLSDCYVEFTCKEEALNAVKYTNQKLMKGRPINVSFCMMEELLGLIFPRWNNGFTGNKPNFLPSSSLHTFITQDEIDSLLNICKNYKVHFSRKCAERPFENIITIITKYPWEHHDLVSASEKNQIFDLLRLSIETLQLHLAKETIHIDRTLRERLVRAGIMCPAFTEEQKTILLQTADISKCPADIESFMHINSQLQQTHEFDMLSCNIPHTIKDEYQLESSFVHVMPSPVSVPQNNNQQRVSSLLNILNDSGSNNTLIQNQLGEKEEETELPLKNSNNVDSENFETASSSSSESDEDSYCFCEKEDDDEDEYSLYKIEL